MYVSQTKEVAIHPKDEAHSFYHFDPAHRLTIPDNLLTLRALRVSINQDRDSISCIRTNDITQQMITSTWRNLEPNKLLGLPIHRSSAAILQSLRAVAVVGARDNSHVHRGRAPDT